ADDGASRLGLAVKQPGSQAGADDIDVAEHHRRAGAKPDQVGRLLRERGVFTRPIDDWRKQVAQALQPKQADDLVSVIASPEISEGKAPFRWIGSALSGKLKIEPVLAMERRGGTLQALGHMPQYVHQLRALLAGSEARGGSLEPGPVVRAGTHPLNGCGGAGVQPQPGRTNRLAPAVDEPRAVALPRHCDPRRPARQLGPFF